MPLTINITRDFDQMSKVAADLVERDILEKQAVQENYVLGLATGNSPTGLYKHLAKSFNSGRIDSGKIRTFNLDEYVGLPGADPQQRILDRRSYAFFMIAEFFGLLYKKFPETNLPPAALIDQDSLISALNESPEQYELLGDGSGQSVLLKDNVSGFLRMVKKEILEAYEQKIEQAGGIDLQVIGVGGRGHVAFHESGIPFKKSRMMLVKLDDNTIVNAVADGNFSSLDKCPLYAVSMGVELVYQAKTVLLLANGPRKKDPVAESLLGPVSCKVPISYSQNYSASGGRMIYVLDEQAAQGILDNAQVLEAKGYSLVDKRSEKCCRVEDLTFTRNSKNNMLG